MSKDLPECASVVVIGGRIGTSIAFHQPNPVSLTSFSSRR
jgi:hypothetical protein